jgi:molybdopterin synthase catalytic subunit
VGYDDHEPDAGAKLWVGLTTAPLLLDRAAHWVQQPDCGAVVVFGGTVRDQAEGRTGVDELEYEAYDTQVEPRLARIAEQARGRWEGIGRVVIWHRVGTLAVGECSVVVAVSAAHRGQAFDAARFCIDTVKTSVPIWKRERWDGGEDWGLDAHDVADVAEVSP